MNTIEKIKNKYITVKTTEDFTIKNDEVLSTIKRLLELSTSCAISNSDYSIIEPLLQKINSNLKENII